MIANRVQNPLLVQFLLLDPLDESEYSTVKYTEKLSLPHFSFFLSFFPPFLPFPILSSYSTAFALTKFAAQHTVRSRGDVPCVRLRATGAACCWRTLPSPSLNWKAVAADRSRTDRRR